MITLITAFELKERRSFTLDSLVMDVLFLNSLPIKVQRDIRNKFSTNSILDLQ